MRSKSTLLKRNAAPLLRRRGKKTTTAEGWLGGPARELYANIKQRFSIGDKCKLPALSYKRVIMIEPRRSGRGHAGIRPFQLVFPGFKASIMVEIKFVRATVSIVAGSLGPASRFPVLAAQLPSTFRSRFWMDHPGAIVKPDPPQRSGGRWRPSTVL